MGVFVRRTYITALMALLLAGCAGVGDTPSSIPTTDIRIARKIPLAPYMALAVVMPEYLKTQPDMVARLRGLGVFGQVIASTDLPGFVVRHNLQGMVTDLGKWGGYQSLVRAYKPFLVFRFECIDARDGVRYRMIVTRPDNLDNVFVGDVVVMSNLKGETLGLLTLGAGLRESNCWGAVDHGAVEVLFASMKQWLNANIETLPNNGTSTVSSP
jgi:hypothetical protein